MTMAVRPAVPAVALLLVVLSACAGSTAPSGTEDGKKIVTSMRTALTAPGQGVDDADATCIATRFVDALGIQKLQDTKVVGKDFRFDAAGTDPTKADPAVLTAFTAARSHCLEAKVAASMATAIATAGSLVDKQHAACVAAAFTHRAGLARLIGGRAVTTTLTYVSNGAVQDQQNAAAYADALTGCLDKKKVEAALKKAVESAYATGTGGPVIGDPKCFVEAFAKKVGTRGLLGTRLVTDTGTFNNQGARYDENSASTLATAILGCVDVLGSEARSAAATNKKLDAATVETCLRSKISDSYLRDDFLVNRLLGEQQKADAANTVIQSRVSSCERP